MKCTMQQLRARSSDWETTNDIIPEGAIALVYTDDGTFFMKIGDGVSQFRQLPFFGSNVSHLSTGDVTLSRCKDARIEGINDITITFPESLDDDYYSALTFDTADSPMITYPDGITFTGSDCMNGHFLPVADTHYTLFFWYDGSMQCTVRGAQIG